MFTLRPANAGQILPSVPGLSSIERLNSLTVGILWTSHKCFSLGVGRDTSEVGFGDWNHTPRLSALQDRIRMCRMCGSNISDQRPGDDLDDARQRVRR